MNSAKGGAPDVSPVWITLDHGLPSPALVDFLEEVRPYGVILFARHLEDAAQVRELTACIAEARGGDVFIGLDQEGGRVSRLSKLGYVFPGASDVLSNPETARSVAGEMGSVLMETGFHVDFAPVADLGPAGSGTGLEERVYSHRPETVIACCGAFLDGLCSSGILGCIKHFPGLGGSTVDSHEVLPVISGTQEERETHLEPFRALIRRVPFAMVSHGSYGFLEEGVPASLCAKTYTLLRSLGFRGIAVTDDLSMGAAEASGPLGDRVIAALAAGADIALWVSGQERTLRIVERIRKDPRALAWMSALTYAGDDAGEPVFPGRVYSKRGNSPGVPSVGSGYTPA